MNTEARYHKSVRSVFVVDDAVKPFFGSHVVGLSMLSSGFCFLRSKAGDEKVVKTHSR